MSAAEDIDRDAIPAALQILGLKNSDNLRVLMLAIGFQESGFVHRAQVLESGGKGPARGFWQFEQGGVRGVLKFHVTTEPLRLLCRAREVAFDVKQIWMALEEDDILAAGVARLLILTDWRPVPPVRMPDEAWRYYLRNWRPGKPRPDHWSDSHAAARAILAPNQPSKEST